MFADIERTVILGGRGRMAQLMFPYLPDPIALVDIATLEKAGVNRFLPEERAVRRRMASELRPLGGQGSRPRGVSSLCVLSLPSEVFSGKVTASPVSALVQLLGVSCRGYGSTVFVHQTSVHEVPSRILECVSGVALGLHLMHGPGVDRFDDQVAIITVTESKQLHHNYGAALTALEHLLRRRMGYGHVAVMSPERHDSLMSNLQFLTHSMLLVLGDAVLESDHDLTLDNLTGPASAILVLLHRMARQEPHVYAGIATGNPRNEAVVRSMKSRLQGGHFDHEVGLEEGIRAFAEVREELAGLSGMTQSEREHIATPMSRCRDGLIASASRPGPTTVAINLRPALERYLRALEGDYSGWFEALMTRVNAKLETFNIERGVMGRLQALS